MENYSQSPKTCFLEDTVVFALQPHAKVTYTILGRCGLCMMLLLRCAVRLQRCSGWLLDHCLLAQVKRAQGSDILIRNRV